VKEIARKGKLGEVILRRSTTVQPSPAQSPVVREAAKQFSMVTAPVASGNIYRSTRSTVRTTKQGVIVTGSDLIGSVVNTTSSLWQLGTVIPVHPAYFIGTGLANYCRTYTRYRFRNLRFGFHTRMPTSTAGEIMMSLRRNAIEPSEDTTDSSFMSKVMSRNGAVIGPIWANHYADVDCDLSPRLVDAFMTDWNDNIFGELEIYVQTNNTTSEVGYVSMSYEVEFLDVIVTPHTSEIPLASACRLTPRNLVTIPAQAARVIGGSLQATSTNLTTQPDGSIWKIILDFDLSTLGTASNTLCGTLNPTITSATVATLALTNVESYNIVDGAVIYALDLGGSNVSLYITYDAAVVGGLGGLLVHDATTLTTAGTLYGAAHLVRLGYDSLSTA